MIRINIVAFLYTLNPELYFLLLKRSQKRGGFWQPVSGGVEKFEPPIQSVKREIFEETGI
ncbi:NUDIX domain-containing protein [Bacillus sp. Bva_UNVM-123]|uniref:NUDIX domain-containing protein n=1 Tax=Bacillus sp. Bva_UNVM-123 TaxID=2829798 RepID=UPI00391F9E4F